MKKAICVLLGVALSFCILTACGKEADDSGHVVGFKDNSSVSVTESKTIVTDTDDYTGTAKSMEEDGTYSSKEDVALYIQQFGGLPLNFISKKQAQQLGWSGGSLEAYAPGKCIGGSNFGNYEGILPEKNGRVYYECDIDTLGAADRGAKRIVYSNDGLIYYTEDHYESFTLLYGDDGI